MSDPYTLEDFRTQFQSIQKMGLKDMLGRTPGMASVEGEDLDAALRRMRGMLDSMTTQERKDPDIIDAGRRQRIAAGSGVEPGDVTRFLQQFNSLRAIMKQMISMSVWRWFL